MSKLLAGFLAAAVVAFVGCSTPTSKVGGPGVVSSGNESLIGQKAGTFTLSTPTLSTKLKQGESKEVTIGIDKGKNFDEDVTLKFEDLPKGVTVEPASPMIKHGDKEAKVMIKAADDASTGDKTVKLTGHPTKGADAHEELKLTIANK
jgi:uncharacterized membrane protein